MANWYLASDDPPPTWGEVSDVAAMSPASDDIAIDHWFFMRCPAGGGTAGRWSRFGYTTLLRTVRGICAMLTGATALTTTSSPISPTTSGSTARRPV
jgi:hypothetical protein